MKRTPLTALALASLVALSACGHSDNTENNTPAESPSATTSASATPSKSPKPTPTKAKPTVTEKKTEPAPAPTGTVATDAAAAKPAETPVKAADEAPAAPQNIAPAETATAEPASEAPTKETPAAAKPAETPVKAADEAPAAPQNIAPIPGGTLLTAGAPATTITTVSGTGTVPITFTRDANSAAPNLPTYVSTMCDGASVYSGAFNTTGQTTQNISFAGNNCSIQVKVAQPSAKWAGTYNGVYVAAGAPNTVAGTASITAAAWATRPVTGTDTFTLGTPAGFKGGVDVKLTACSSSGGTSDATAAYACGALVQKGVGSSATITISDANGVLGSTSVNISAEQHHGMVHIDTTRPTAGATTLTVTNTGGSAMLVHAPGTRAVGTI